MSNTQVEVGNSVKLVTAKTLAKMLSMSVRTVWRLRSAGKLPEPVTIGGSVRWKLSDIELWQRLGCCDQKTFETRRTCNNEK